MNTQQSSHSISLLVSNKPGVLLRTTIIFARRGFNIESLVVSPAFDGNYSRMTITAKGNDKDLEQIVKQLNKLIDVIDATDTSLNNPIERELALIKVKIGSDQRHDLLHEIDHFKAKTVDLTNESLIIEISGDSDKLNAFIKILNKYEIMEMIRSGKIVIERNSI